MTNSVFVTCELPSMPLRLFSDNGLLDNRAVATLLRESGLNPTDPQQGAYVEMESNYITCESELSALVVCCQTHAGFRCKGNSTDDPKFRLMFHSATLRSYVLTCQH
eukprot:5743231-Pyramimonas_sp.AAC.1